MTTLTALIRKWEGIRKTGIRNQRFFKKHDAMSVVIYCAGRTISASEILDDLRSLKKPKKGKK